MGRAGDSVVVVVVVAVVVVVVSFSPSPPLPSDSFDPSDVKVKRQISKTTDFILSSPPTGSTKVRPKIMGQFGRALGNQHPTYLDRP